MKSQKQILFVKSQLGWPLRSGGDVHTFNMMRSLCQLGFDVSLITEVPVSKAVVEQIPEVSISQFSSKSDREPAGFTTIRRAYHRYWGVSRNQVSELKEYVDRYRPNAVVALSPSGALYLAGLSGTLRVWYLADDLCRTLVTNWESAEGSFLKRCKTLVIQSLYERFMRTYVDRAWLVTQADEDYFVRVSGNHRTAVIPNGVDQETYPVISQDGLDDSCMFWGRLDFPPNILAIQYFIENVWPLVRKKHPEAVFKVCGMSPDAFIRRLCNQPGVLLKENVPSIEHELSEVQVAVFPIISGTGLKNKVLEAASFGKPILSTNLGMNGLGGVPPMERANSPLQWQEQLTRLWSSKQLRDARRSELPKWVAEFHSWRGAAILAAQSIGLCSVKISEL